MPGLLGKKIGMTSVFSADGKNVPCTVIEAGPCVVTQIKSVEKDGYAAVQLGFQEAKEKNTTAPLMGHFKKAGTTPKRHLAEFTGFEQELNLGDTVTVDMFEGTVYVDVIGTSKGKGFQGVVKRHGFGGVGESEQNMKKVFDKYRNICKSTSLAPILLFNEADAILGVRMEGATRAVDKMENSIQNIILQEMEALEGIMIATTNLTTNLDKAFERRFLYKVEFNRPTVEARAQIWQAMFPALAERDACTLASQFDLSGGEIENISRKYMVNAILSGQDTIDLLLLAELCRNERIGTSTRQRIGFQH